MNYEVVGLFLMYLTVLGLAIPLGRYIGKVFEGERTLLDPLFNHLDRWMVSLSGADCKAGMDWKQILKSMLLVNFIWFVISMVVLSNMAWLPLNPDGNPSMSPDLAFNSTISFITNTNLQHYSGETGLSYLGQVTLMLWQFISAAIGLSVCGLVFNAMKEKTSRQLGNFYHFFLRSGTRILLPLALVEAVMLCFSGVPMTFKGKDSITTLEGAVQKVSRGPVAAFEAIKQIGTNGGGFYGTNSANPMENPTYFTNFIETLSIFLLPIALVFCFGYVIKRKKMAWMVYGVMTVGFLLLIVPTIYHEMGGNPMLSKLHIFQPHGNMEGKEIRIGAAASANWGIYTTVTSNGSVNSMHDSFTPVGGLMALLGMMVNCFYGGVGVGFLNFYVFIILTVFISGLMVGRTPELLGKKVEAKEMKIAMIIALLHPLLILAGTALTCHLYNTDPKNLSSWLANPGYHGFSEILYEFTSASANNGSGFEGLGDNTPFWNISTGIVMLLARYLPIIGPVAIAGLLAQKKYIPESNGTLKTDTPTFGIMIFAVIAIVAALSFFPALTLGPVAEYFTISATH